MFHAWLPVILIVLMPEKFCPGSVQLLVAELIPRQHYSESTERGNGAECHHGNMQVPREHQEIVRLEGRYKSQGGLKEGMVVELANGESAIVVDLKDESVQIDANNMMAGKTRTFEVMLQSIEPANQ